MYGIIYTIHAPLCSIHFLISLIDKSRFFSSVLLSDFFIYFCLQYQLVIGLECFYILRDGLFALWR